MSPWRDISAWLDEDGYHVWIYHQCVLGGETTMLPYPRWQAKEGFVTPSVVCNECGLHEIPPIREKRA